MSIFASVYTDEDVAKLVSTLLKARGINATNTPAQGKIRPTSNGFVGRIDSR
jgi:hypothetical protein